MNRNVQTTQFSGIALLIEWANGQDHWIRKLVADVIETRSRLSDECIANLYELFLREKELSPGDPPNVERLSASRISAPATTTMRLASLKHIGNVNALAPGQEIEFHRRLTVCFGENASGKTGYVRILKRAAAVRTAQSVLPNIHAGGSRRKPRVTIKIALGDEEHAIDWQGEQGVEPLTRVDVFDARAAVAHLAEDLTYSYTPADLALFPLVKDGIERVQNRLHAAKEERSPHERNSFTNRLRPESRLYAQIETLGPSTDLQGLQALAQLSKEEEAGLPGLREKISALRSGSVRSQIEAMNRERNLLAEILSIAETIARFDRDTYREAISALRTARANHEQATREALAGEKVPGILGEAWQEFVEAAEGYIGEVGLDSYPDSGAPCIYCRQPLNEAAVGLIRKYRNYCNAALHQAVEQARGRIRTLGATVRNLRLDETERNIDRHLQALADPGSSRPDLTAAREVIRLGRLVHQVVTDGEDCPPTFAEIRHARDTIRTAMEVAETALVDLGKQGGERERALAKEQARLLELEERLTLRELIPAIRGHVQATQWVDRCASHLQGFQGIKRNLTDTAKRASDEVMNQHFQELFQEECRSLRTPSVTLHFPGREGQIRRQKRMTSEYGLGEILSEGEQKVIALADFLAEATLNPSCSPIVLDDPVTSLDHKRLRHVVSRVVELSRHRQIIVFTHDIWFAAELLSCFEREPNECAFYEVMAEDQRIGLIERGSHPRTDTFKDRKRHINVQIEQAAREIGEKRHALVEKGYEELRGACEIVVEKDLLKGVTERYRPNVRMTVLDQICADRLPDAIRKIVPIFERCCGIISSHSQPLVTRGVRPTLDELRDDWNTLQDARREYLQK